MKALYVNTVLKIEKPIPLVKPKKRIRVELHILCRNVVTHKRKVQGRKNPIFFRKYLLRKIICLFSYNKIGEKFNAQL